MAYLHKARPLWEGDAHSPTIYMSYWLSASATYLAKHRQDLRGLCVSRAHGYDCFYDRGIIPYRKMQLTGLDGIFPISDMGKQDLLAHYSQQVPGLSEKVQVHHLGVHCKNSANRAWHPGQVHTVVSCSSMISLKRLDLLVDALSQCHLPIHWIHYGDGPLRGQIMAAARDKLDELPDITYEFRGSVPNQEILRFYETVSVDLFVNCSDSEGIPVSIMEAMAYGIPAVARNVGGNGEIVDHTGGQLLPKDICSSDLAQAINKLLTLPVAQVTAIRHAAAEKIAAQFEAETNYQNFYDQLEASLFSVSQPCENAPKRKR